MNNVIVKGARECGPHCLPLSSGSSDQVARMNSLVAGSTFQAEWTVEGLWVSPLFPSPDLPLPNSAQPTPSLWGVSFFFFFFLLIEPKARLRS